MVVRAVVSLKLVHRGLWLDVSWLGLDLLSEFDSRAALLFVDGQSRLVLGRQQSKLRSVLLDHSGTSATAGLHNFVLRRESCAQKRALSGLLVWRLFELVQILRFQLLVSNCANIFLYHFSIVFLCPSLDYFRLYADHQSVNLLSMIQ